MSLTDSDRFELKKKTPIFNSVVTKIRYFDLKMADFEDNFEQDPAAEFLQREQSALAGLEDEIPPVATNAPNGKRFVMHKSI